MKSVILVATVIFSAATFTGCKKDSASSGQWGAETLSDFYISPVEVTTKLWADVMGFIPEGQSNHGDAYPVSNVNYYDIAGEDGFIDKLNAMCKGQLPEGKRFALPTEAQWEYAARGGQKSRGYKYAGSDTIDEVAWYGRNATLGFRIVLRKR